MPSSRSAGSFTAGFLTVLTLGIVWGTVLLGVTASPQPETVGGPIFITPSNPSPDTTLRLRNAPAVDSSVPPPQASAAPSSPKPADPLRSVPDQTDYEPQASLPSFPPPNPPDDAPRQAEELRLPANVEIKCQAELERICPASLSGDDRLRCAQRSAQKLPLPCQRTVLARVARAKEDLQRIRFACEEDARRFCRQAGRRGGQILQCLEEHAQEISDRCFQALPKRPVINFETGR
ncbi:MAG: cysteine rich repeat-containing protein [Nitrospirota bacterium]